APDDPRKETVYRHFQRNLDDILEAGANSGAHVILSTVAVNLKDCPPFASVSETNLPAVNRRAFEECVAHASAELQQGAGADAARHYQEALQLNPKSAELQFRLGQCFLNQTNTVAARQYFQTALDLDELMFRADSKLNNLIRAAAVQWAQRGITLCD